MRRIIHRKIYKEVNGEIKYDHNIHHIDGNYQNNKISNLISVPIDIHSKYHRYESNMMKSFTKKDKYGFEYSRDMMIRYYYEMMEFKK